MLNHAVGQCPLPYGVGISKVFVVKQPGMCAICNDEWSIGPGMPPDFALYFGDMGAVHRECLLPHLQPFTGHNAAVPLMTRVNNAITYAPESVATVRFVHLAITRRIGTCAHAPRRCAREPNARLVARVTPWPTWSLCNLLLRAQPTAAWPAMPCSQPCVFLIVLIVSSISFHCFDCAAMRDAFARVLL